MEKVNWGMWVAFCLRLALQKLDGELGIVLELALRLFLRPGGHELGIVPLDCSWPSSTWCWPKIGGQDGGRERMG